jgi:hypothetical protein
VADLLQSSPDGHKSRSSLLRVLRYGGQARGGPQRRNSHELCNFSRAAGFSMHDHFLHLRRPRHRGTRLDGRSRNREGLTRRQSNQLRAPGRNAGGFSFFACRSTLAVDCLERPQLLIRQAQDPEPVEEHPVNLRLEAAATRSRPQAGSYPGSGTRNRSLQLFARPRVLMS